MHWAAYPTTFIARCNPRRNRVYLLPTRRRRHSRKRSLIRIGQPDLYSVTGGVFLLSSRGSFLSPSNTRNFPNRSIRILGKVDSPVGIMFYAMMIYQRNQEYRALSPPSDGGHVDCMQSQRNKVWCRAWTVARWLSPFSIDNFRRGGIHACCHISYMC